MALRPNVAKLKTLLMKAGVIDEFQARAAMGRLEQWGGRLTGVVVDMGFCDDERMLHTLSKALNVPILHLGMVPRDAALLAKIDAEFCSEHGIFPVSLQNRVATIAMSDPTELDTVDALAARLGTRVQIAVASESEIRAAIAKHYRGQAVPATRRQDTRARDEHIAATSGEVFELDMTRAPKPGGEGQVAASQAWMNKPPSANTMLDEFLEEEAPAGSDGFTPEELARIEAAVENQAKAAAILRALQALLTEKGYLR
jgi:type IV pilus assembly protein PilB